MNTTTLPGDWTTRGTVVVAETVESIPSATRYEVLRAVAVMVRDGMTVIAIEAKSPTGKADAKWTRIVSVNRGDGREVCRAAARKAMAGK